LKLPLILNLIYEDLEESEKSILKNLKLPENGMNLINIQESRKMLGNWEQP